MLPSLLKLVMALPHHRTLKTQINLASKVQRPSLCYHRLAIAEPVMLLLCSILYSRETCFR